MNPESWLTIFKIFSFIGAFLVFVSTIGVWHFSSKIEKQKDSKIDELLQGKNQLILKVNKYQNNLDKKDQEIKKLKSDFRTIDSIHGLVSLKINGNWVGNNPPNGPVHLFFGSKETMALEILTRTKEKKNLKFIGSGSPYIISSNSQEVDFQFKIVSMPNSWILGKDKNEISACGAGQIKINGLYPNIVKDSELCIKSLSIKTTVKGKPFFKIAKDINEKIKLDKGYNSIIIRWDKKECNLSL